MNENRLKEAAQTTPDPTRSYNNLSTFLSENPSRGEELERHLLEAALLFSVSQFLANFSIVSPDRFFEAVSTSDGEVEKDDLSSTLKEQLAAIGDPAERVTASSYLDALDPFMGVVREFRIAQILRITLRDVLGKTDLVETMLELSGLADVIIDESLIVVRTVLAEVFGRPEKDAFAVIALGKLGGEELNFSSDVDLMYVYGTEEGETSGVSSMHSISSNRVSNHEYYCKIGETLTRFLSLNTETGFAYRVDLRLRPEGQRGDIALSLRGYEMYYESWGRAWERAMLLRARPAGGDAHLGTEFIDMIRPFVFRKYLDYSSIDEIKRLKKRIDATFKKGDIKRGYGGIREIEFFTQALQLLYAGREPILRERSILKALHRLLQKGFIGHEDFSVLSESYRFFRTLEHRLQQLNDIQTHTVPSRDEELSILARKMDFRKQVDFTVALEEWRKKVRSIYDSLFGGAQEEVTLSGTFFDEEFTDGEMRDHLGELGIQDPERAVRHINSIKNSMVSFQTLRGRKLLGEILPLFVDEALRSRNPDHALNHLQSFAGILSERESYLEAFRDKRELIKTLTYVFSQSEYLSKLLVARPQYLEMIGLQEAGRKSIQALRQDIADVVSEGRTLNDAVRVVKQTEEIRLGLLFLERKIPVLKLMKGLSKTAEAVLATSLENVSEGKAGLSVIGFGKLGGRGMTFGSDLDIIFVAPSEVHKETTRTAERLLRMLLSHTREGLAYRVDTRLRPDGSKGPLVASIESFRRYYERAAAFWEFQALLRARPIAGDIQTGLAFLELARQTLVKRGRDISAADIVDMRERIIRELVNEADGYDLKLGPGGMEEIEFAVQYLQLSSCHVNDGVLVQGTLKAIDRLRSAGVLRPGEASELRRTYLFYRALESFLRLRGESLLKRNDDILGSAGEFMGCDDSAEFTSLVEKSRENVVEITRNRLRG